MSDAALARALGVSAAVVRRLESGTVAPSGELAAALTEVLDIVVAESETNIGSIPLLRLASEQGQDGPAADDARTFSHGGEEHEIELPSYCLNGPADQRPFHDRLIALQEGAAIEWPTYRKRLSLVASADGEPTRQSLLERPRAKAMSWSSNYGSHGWHRYVGRFPPHLVRALLNGFGADQDSLVCDPFAGSGTTLVECRLLGIPAIGIEISPLSALISRTKACFPADPAVVRRAGSKLAEFFAADEIWPARRLISHEDVFSRPGNLVEPFTNVERWFTPEALLGVSIATEFAATQRGYARDLVLLALSSKMRSIGNVDVDVVRAEYRDEPRRDVDVCRLLVRQVEKFASSIEASVESHADLIGSPRSVSVLQGNALKAQIEPGSITHVITSPPYGVESLSYLRTHLLSFRALSSVLKQDPYEAGEGVIGSEYLEASSGGISFPRAERSHRYNEFFSSIDVETLAAGDRRRTAMMMKFFDDMAQVAETLVRWLAPGGSVAFVIGNKKLKDRVVPTAEIVVELFAEVGLELEDTIDHKLKTNNSNSVVPWQERIIGEEFVLLFRKEG
jgi:transcriptional regulator with XRE-family HTH domain